MRGFFTFLVLTFIGVRIVYAQQPIEKIEKKIEAHKEIKSDTTQHKPLGISKEIKKDLKGQKDRIVSQVKGAKHDLQSDVKKLTKKPDARQKATDIKALKAEEVTKVKEVAKQSFNNAGIGNVKKVDSDLKRQGKELKSEAKREAIAIQDEVPDTADAKSFSQKIHRKMLDEKITQMQYSSDDPKNAPWNKKMFSKDDLGNIKIPAAPKSFLPSKENALQNDEDKLKNSKVIDPSKALGSGLLTNVDKTLKPEKLTQLEDSLVKVDKQFKTTLDIDAQKQKPLNTKKIYSDKYFKKIYDSLGGKKADSLFKVASKFTKTETPKEELLNKINNSISGKQLGGAKFDAAKQDLHMNDADKIQNVDKDFAHTNLDGIKKGDLSNFTLPQSVLSELPPLSGMELDAKYLPLVDSMRNINLKAKGYVMEDKKVTEDVKRSVLKRKPSFINKLYFDGIVGLYKDTAINVIKLSPSVGYHFKHFLSAGLGPNFLLQVKDKKMNVQAGLRPFMKAEIWKQRAYLQLEDNIKTSKVDTELGKNGLVHEILGGGGVVLPISGSLGINLQLLYRLNKLANNPNQSPWVFRVGLSSIKKLK